MQDILVKALEEQDYLMHHGILGQKWGVRRYQNSDGTLTDAGKKRYSGSSRSDKLNEDGSLNKKGMKLVDKIYDGKYGPSDMFKHQVLSSASEVINSNETNRRYSKALINKALMLEEMESDLFNNYGVDHDTDIGELNLSRAEKEEVSRVLSVIEDYRNDPTLINAYAKRLAGENDGPASIYKIEKLIYVLETNGYLDPYKE